MDLFEVICIAVALSMDAAAVSLSNGMAYSGADGGTISGREVHFTAPFMFGAFQGIMPAVGYFAGGLFVSHISRFADVLVCAILCFLGLKMLLDGFKGEQEDSKVLTGGVIFTQAVATSIDAFAVGIGFRAQGVNILASALIIATTTFLISAVSSVAGKTFGKHTGEHAVIFGGIILIIIGIKSLF